MDIEFETILAESFNQAYTNNVPISTSEANNINEIFVGNEVKTECIICYEDNNPCIKCFQCTAVYCKLCLTKIASESNKCICAIDIRANYSKLKKYNQDLIKKAIDNKIKKDKMKQTTSNIKNNNKKKNDNKNDNDNKKNNKKNDNNHNNTQQNQNSLNMINYNDNYYDTLSSDDNNSNNSDNSDNSDNSSNYNSNSNSNNINTNNYNSDSSLTLKLNYLKDLTDNNIYNIDFKSFCNKVGNTIPNFDYFWDYQNKQLTFYAIPNRNQELKNIVFNYTILNSENQGEIYVWILELLALPFNTFKEKWNTIADIMPKITNNNKIDMISKIVELCK
jgi:hypothetical protein